MTTIIFNLAFETLKPRGKEHLAIAHLIASDKREITVVAV